MKKSDNISTDRNDRNKYCKTFFFFLENSYINSVYCALVEPDRIGFVGEGPQGRNFLPVKSDFTLRRLKKSLDKCLIQ